MTAWIELFQLIGNLGHAVEIFLTPKGKPFVWHIDSCYISPSQRQRQSVSSVVWWQYYSFVSDSGCIYLFDIYSRWTPGKLPTKVWHTSASRALHLNFATTSTWVHRQLHPTFEFCTTSTGNFIPMTFFFLLSITSQLSRHVSFVNDLRSFSDI